jgi:N-glycosylase/DNA lyase
MSENNLITYQIKNIDREVWGKFKSSVYGRGFNTIDSCLKAFIKEYSEGRCSVKG